MTPAQIEMAVKRLIAERDRLNDQILCVTTQLVTEQRAVPEHQITILVNARIHARELDSIIAEFRGGRKG